MHTLSPIVSTIVFWLAVVACTAGEFAIIRSARRGPLTQGTGYPLVRRGPEVVWAVIPAIALAIVLVMTWRTMHRATANTRDVPGVVVMHDR
jgi:heme/copper-type cytochrome/quinol oxidase subunit 2